MKLVELICSPWAMPRANLEEVIAIYETHCRGDKIDLKALETRIGRPLENAPPAYDVDGGVAVLRLEGMMAPKANLFQDISGGISTQMAEREVMRAARDPAAPYGLILAWDTPGGNAVGISEFAATIRAAQQLKPVLSWCDGQMCSAGYYAGSAAEKVYISGEANQVGSLGVVVAHRDMSEAQRQRGIKVTEITAGKYKRVASENGPLTEEGRATLQAYADYCYSVMVNAVAEHRGVTPDKVLSDMADGRVFIGRQAIEAGLVDGVATLDSLIADLQTRASSTRTAPLRAGVAHSSTGARDMPPNDQIAPLTRETLEREQPALFAALRTEFMAAGAVAERERVTAVRAAALPGHEALIEQLANDGHTTGDQAASAVLAAERTARQAAAAAHAAEAPPAAPGARVPAGGEKTKEQQVIEAKAYAKEHGVEFVEAVKALGFA